MGAKRLEKEHEILANIANNGNVTQRKLAETSGLSLGAVNILMKRLIKKGFVKVEQLNSKSFRYILTPDGIIEKTKKTYDYIADSYNYIARLTHMIKEIIAEESDLAIVYIMGEKDEVYKIILSTIKDIGVNYKVIEENELDEKINKKQSLAFAWNREIIKVMENANIKCVNILEI